MTSEESYFYLYCDLEDGMTHCSKCDLVAEKDWWCNNCNSFVIATYEENCDTCGDALDKHNCYCEK